MKRRDFLKASALTGGSMWILPSSVPAEDTDSEGKPRPGDSPALSSRPLPDLSPARWIWYPSGRCLQNTFVLFRRELELPAQPKAAQGWICADSRYLLEVNGKRVQWGPPPCDPRWAEADPVNIAGLLQPGKNVIAVTVLFYGQGDGTWPIGKPGFLFFLEVEPEEGQPFKVVSNADWRALLCRAWTPGHYKRWYLRALQEEFDARLYPQGWQLPTYRAGADWLPAMVLSGSPNKPALSTQYYEYLLDVGSAGPDTELRPRSIPLLEETAVPVAGLTEAVSLEWLRPPQEYFECRPPNAWKVHAPLVVQKPSPGEWRVPLDDQGGSLLTFELSEQVVGWPFFTIDAPAGTTIELLVHEAHRPGSPPLLNTHFDSWSRFICKEGVNRFECFDFESLRWLQLHIHGGGSGSAIVRQVGVRRRKFPWPQDPVVRTDERPLQKLFDACLNTLHNSAQETCVDGMARERQQYSGDGGHQLHGLYLAMGETRLPARFLETFSQGMTLDGYFLDCWPAYDRLARLVERQLQLSGWGPILDHGIGFNFDCWHYFNYTGDLDALREPYPRLLRFANYLKDLVGKNGLLPVENLGIPSVWIDHAAFQRQQHKQCSFNLYAAAMLHHALLPICEAFGQSAHAAMARSLGSQLLDAARKHFWSRERGLYIDNLPWLTEERQVRLSDRTLATAVLFDQCPGQNIKAATDALVACPPEMGFSYPANAGWRLWALAKAGRPETIVQDLRRRWATMDSVRLNNTLQEDWIAQPDSGQQWSHCAIVPLYIAYHALAGIRPLAPGFARAEIRPQLADLSSLELVAHTVKGPLRFTASGKFGDRELLLEMPPGCDGELVVSREEPLNLQRVTKGTPRSQLRYLLPGGEKIQLRLAAT